MHIQIIPEKGESPHSFCERIAEILNKEGASVVRATFFGHMSESESTLKYLKKKIPDPDFPATWIAGDNCTDGYINGVYIFAVSQLQVKRIYRDNIPVGSFYQTGEASFCWLGGLYADGRLSPSGQTAQILNRADKILVENRFRYENTVRTWFYLDEILEWYTDFNKERTAFFLHHDIFNKRVAASTGIAGRNPAGSKVCLELTAIKPENEQFTIQVVKSPLQCSAEDYGSAFSRAIRYADRELTTMSVSGTASIDPGGKSLHKGDFYKQVDLTFSVVKALLKSQGFSLDDMVRAYAYCSHKNLVNQFMEYIDSSLPDNFTTLISENKICREELLFEFEIDVVRRNDPDGI